MSQRPDTRDLLDSIKVGDESALGQLLQRWSTEISAQARRLLARERPGYTLSPHDLVQEVFIKMAPQVDASITDKEHFLSVVTLLVRRILCDRARKGRLGRDALPSSIAAPDDSNPIDLLDLEAALEALAKIAPLQADIVKLKYFGHLTGDQIAGILGVSPRTVDSEWSLARAWLYRRLM